MGVLAVAPPQSRGPMAAGFGRSIIWTCRSRARGGQPARSWAYFFFFSPSETGFPAPKLAVAKTFGLSCLGFFTSLFPRLLLPFPITTSQVE
ncbi:MAG: hypothetical protein JXJ18_02065 [Rhodobacteraceae bacterium]|nr:hypothetical protein [Paracoccaceae bacterium]